MGLLEKITIQSSANIKSNYQYFCKQMNLPYKCWNSLSTSSLK